MYILYYSAQTSGVNQTAEPLKLTQRTPSWGSIEPRLRTTDIERMMLRKFRSQRRHRQVMYVMERGS